MTSKIEAVIPAAGGKKTMGDLLPLKIFYSWQSDLPDETHRFFIRDVIKSAIKKLNRESVEIEDALREEGASGAGRAKAVLDHDTKDVPGIPEIANTIFEKISNSDLFVADVSYVAKCIDSKGRERCFPNSNVSIELGYAIKSLGSDRVILVMDSAQGPPEKLPFDLLHRRFPLSFSSGNEQKSEAKKLQARFEDALRSFVMFHDDREEPVPLYTEPTWRTIIKTIVWSDSQDDWHSVSSGFDKQVRYYLEDVNLRFELAQDSREKFKTDWTDKFPDQNAASYDIVLSYGNTIIDTIRLAAVDGSKVFLPLPDPGTLNVDAFNYKVASIFDYHGLLPTYFDAAGLKRTWMQSN